MVEDVLVTVFSLDMHAMVTFSWTRTKIYVLDWMLDALVIIFSSLEANGTWFG